jgi:hypothetical protein
MTYIMYACALFVTFTTSLLFAVPQRTPVQGTSVQRAPMRSSPMPGMTIPKQDPITFLGSLEYPQDFKGEQKLYILYKGVMYPIDIQRGSKKKAARGYYEIYDNQMPRVLYILVTQDLKRPESGVIKWLQTSAEFPYRVFRLRQVEYRDTSKSALFSSLPSEPVTVVDQTDGPLMMWDIEEMPHNEVEWRIPDATIVLFMPASYIESLENATWSPTRPVVRLPRIVFKKDIEETLFNQMVDEMQLALMNFKPFHAEPMMKTIPYQNRTVAMPSSLPASVIAT